MQFHWLLEHSANYQDSPIEGPAPTHIINHHSPTNPVFPQYTHLQVLPQYAISLLCTLIKTLIL